MKEIKAEKEKTGQLLEAREQNLQHVERGSLRPHGKLWGMDVFSWYNPMVFELENTLTSFPAPVLWFANAADVTKLAQENESALANVRLICTHDDGGFSLPEHIFSSVESCMGTQALNDALALIRAVKRNQGILLFTASGEDWKSRRETFEFFLDIHQA